MPNRILKESICMSADVDSLSWFEEVLFYRLIVSCDDYGRFDGRINLIKNRLFPLKDGLTTKNVENAISKLSIAGLVMPYSCDGKPFLQLTGWDKHQQIRAHKSKYPAPEECSRFISDDITCNQMISDDIKCPRNPIQSESNPNPIQEESKGNPIDSTERFANESSASAEPPVIALPLNDGSEWPVAYAKWQEWTSLYPAVDVTQALRNMRGWLIANTAKRKTRKGVERFVVAWLSREQDKGGNGFVDAKGMREKKSTGNPFAELVLSGELKE